MATARAAGASGQVARGGRDLAADAEQLEKVVELPVDVTDDRHGRSNVRNIRVALQYLLSLVAKSDHLVLGQRVAVHDGRDLTIEVIEIRCVQRHPSVLGAPAPILSSPRLAASANRLPLPHLDRLTQYHGARSSQDPNGDPGEQLGANMARRGARRRFSGALWVLTGHYPSLRII